MEHRRLNCFVTRFAFWLVTLALFPVPVNFLARSFAVEVLECRLPSLPERDRVALPPQCGVEERAASLELSDRVLIRLVEAESKEPDAWFRDDYRVARVAVGLARHGSPIPHIEATYKVLGIHPDQVCPRIQARREAVLAAADYKKFFGGVSSPRKPARSVTLAEVARRNRAA